MKLSDIMSNAGLSGYAEVALVLFVLAFVVIVIRTFLPSRQRELDAIARLPLEDAPIVTSVDDIKSDADRRR
ncbi:MAG: CcoQ/FixQ family Cbb3-type cytochrome c oxidase assembly chaperone [Gemmatimonadaceae bacterium]